MSLKQVYITQTASFFPNEPVQNDEMEEYLGYINNTPSKSKAIVLRNNGIKRRYYAMTRDKKPTHTNAELAAASVRKLFSTKEELKDVELLSCGTSSPDQMMPSHGVMVHGYLPELGDVEVVSPSGVCCAGMHALKYAYLAVRAGNAKKAIASGSERFSASLVAANFEDEAQRLKELSNDPYISFDKEFLRWMLSDGASSFLLSDQPNKNSLSLRIDWIEGTSNAGTHEACM